MSTVEVKVVHPRPPVKGWDMTGVMQGSVNDACEEPLRPRREVWENCASHGCPPLQKSDSDLVLPSAMKGLRRLMLPIATGGDVCCVLKCSSDGRMRPPIRCPDKRAAVNVLFVSVLRFHSACAASLRAAAAMEEATHTSKATLRPGTTAVVKISAGLDCEAVGLLGSVVMPGSASFMPQTTA